MSTEYYWTVFKNIVEDSYYDYRVNIMMMSSNNCAKYSYMT